MMMMMHGFPITQRHSFSHTTHHTHKNNSATLAAYLSEVLAVFPIHSALAHHAAAAAGGRSHNDDDPAALMDEEEDGSSSGASSDAAKPVLPLSVYLRLEELRMGGGGGGGVWAAGDREGEGEMAVQVRFGGFGVFLFGGLSIPSRIRRVTVE